MSSHSGPRVRTRHLAQSVPSVITNGQMNMAKWQDIITDDFDAGYSAIAEDIATSLWDTSLLQIAARYSEEVKEQCETLLTTVLLEILKMEEQKAISNYKQAILGINQQKEH